MTYTSKLFKMGNSMLTVIPREIVEKLKLYKGQTMVLKIKKGKINIFAIDDYIAKKEKIDNNG